ncbi:Guanosine-3',5'-bis(diphosphate) 3'-pyrophosphohydrolase / GTP pyrophosphokinase, (p)ppGpp synthetase II, partial [hydrothermal vent metagenome]
MADKLTANSNPDTGPAQKPQDSPALRETHNSENETNGSTPRKVSHPVGFIRQAELVDLVRAYDRDADEDILNRAYIFAMKAHGGQTRQSGDPYFSHPLAVAAILTELRADPATVVTALLHDVVEDTDYTISDIEKN